MAGLVLLHAARRVLDLSGFHGDTAGMKGEFFDAKGRRGGGKDGLPASDSNASDIDIQDMMWLFFQNCFLLRDWIANDDKVPKEEKEVVLDKSFASTPIQYARALCEGTKHLAPGKKVRPFHVNITIEPRD